MTTQSFEFGDAIGHFFKTLGRRPGGTLWVALWNAVLMSVLLGAVFWLVGPAYFSLIEMALTGHEPQPEDLWATMTPFFYLFPLSFIGGVVVALMAQGAWLRLLVRNEVAAGIPLRFGVDELRLLGVNLVYVVFAFAIYIAFLLFGILLAVAFAASDNGMAAGATAGLLGGLFFLVVLVAVLVLGIRLSAAPALSVLDRKFRFFESWGATAKIFWWLLLTYLVMIVIIFAAQMVLGTMIQFIFLGAFIPLIVEASQVTDPDAFQPEQWMDMVRDQFSNPVTIAFVAVGAVLSLLLQTICEALWHSVGANTAIRYRTPPAAPVVEAPVVPAAPTPEPPLVE